MQPSNLRTLLEVKSRYASFNREERNYAALLYHFLMSSDAALQAFLGLFEHSWSGNPDDIEIYFEYAHARDLWKYASRTDGSKTCDSRELNGRRRAAIEHLLDPEERIGAKTMINDALSKLDGEFEIERFNALFDAKPISTKSIQMPGRWGKDLLRNLGHPNEELRNRAWRLKWAFNAKADLVIHTGDKAVLCVELKYESKEGAYRANMGEEEPYSTSQLKLQQFILKDLLGLQGARFALISKNGKIPNSMKSEDVVGKSWKEVFITLMREADKDSNLLCNPRSNFVKQMIDTLCRDKP